LNDQMNEQNMQMDNEQKTNVIPKVQEGAPPVQANFRHRRTERYRTNAENAVEAAQEPQAAEGQTTRVQTTRFSVQAPQQRGEVPSQGVPRPAALTRKPEQPASGTANAVRRPISAPGYSQRQPLGQEPRQQLHTGEQPKVRRPVNIEELNDDYKEEFRQSAKKEKAKKKRGNHLLVALVVILLVLGLVVLGFLLIPEDDSTLGQMKTNVVSTLNGLMGQREEKVVVPDAQAMDFAAAPTQATAPVEVMLTLTTSKAVSGVRVVDEEGNVLPTTTAVTMDNADFRIWMLNMAMEEAYTGLVKVQISDGETWLDTDKTQLLEIAEPQVADVGAFAALEPTATPEATQEPTEVPTEVPTEAPTEVPTQEPVAVTEVPTEEPTEVPTEEPTEVPTEEPTAEPTQEPVVTPTMVVTATPTMAPTEEPTPEPTAEPTATPTVEPTAEPTVGPTAAPAFVPQAVEAADPALVAYSTVYNGTSKIDNYDRLVEDVVAMPAAGYYITQPYGVVTHRGDAFRQNAAIGNVGDISTMSLKWTAEASSVKGANQTYYGIGWTGQPVIIKWSKEVREASNIVDEKRATKALKEVIVAGMDGRIYFLDLADGLPTREAINVGYPMRGTPSIHPLGYPVMSVGQYARKMAKGTGDIGLRFYDLLTQKQVHMINGLDGKMNRPYYAVGAFDTSALIDPVSDTLVTAGTNGMVYLTKLNTTFDYNAGTIEIEPESIVMKSKKKGQQDKTVAVEASVAAYDKYMFYGDLSGLVRCVNTSSLETVWAVETGDQVQAALALDFDAENNLWLYTANTLQNRSKGDVTIRRFNAMTGEESWALAIGSQKNNKNNKIPGAMGSPVIGQNELSDLVVYTLSNLSKAGAQAIFGESAAAMAGATIALDKATGEIVWAQQLDSYSYSSPVAVYSETGKGWIIQASGNGMLYLMDGLTGEVVNTLEVEGTIEGSPAVYGNTLVIGTTGKKTSFIYGITLE